MTHPRKHHYLPEFYLRRWVGADDRLTEFRRPHKALVERRKFPSETGFERELYSIKTREDEAARQELETGFLRKVDNDAAQALAFLEEHRSTPTDDRLRDGWVRFIMSLLHRAPWRVDWMRRQLAEHEVEVLADIKTRWNEVRGPGDPATFEEYMATPHAKTLVDENLAKLLTDMMDSEMIGSALARMHWGFARLGETRFGLMTSDSPVMVSNGIGHKDGFVALPTSPTTFFIAANRAETINAFRTQTNRALELAFNDAVVRQARHLVIAPDARQFGFVEKRFRPDDASRDDMNRLTWNSPLIDVPAPKLPQSATSGLAYMRWGRPAS
ncbi:MAG TPA: DUF4238 domain-containing protein [Allosphingosinicella sp.]|jgi:hypothetical protein